VVRKARGARLVLLLALLAFVFAGLATSSLGADEPERASDSAPEPLAGPSEEAAAEHAAREQREEKRRRTPEAKEERRKSKTAYRDSSGSEARELAKRKFEVLVEPLWEPPKLGDGERLGRFLGDHAQLVERGDGEAPSSTRSFPCAPGTTPATRDRSTSSSRIEARASRPRTRSSTRACRARRARESPSRRPAFASGRRPATATSSPMRSTRRRSSQAARDERQGS